MRLFWVSAWKAEREDRRGIYIYILIHEGRNYMIESLNAILDEGIHTNAIERT